MSIASRAPLVGGVKPQDENPRFAAKNAKSTTTRRVGAVLGDITNVSSQAALGQGGLKQVRSHLSSVLCPSIDLPSANRALLTF